ncbi:MAG: ATP synthase F1 subunit gamma [Legionellales bacterium]|jgi:F-type H+-transporting ATPase subunit gamma|nr:ATP synthase F1 subunit gamma [Legionellales bacterium]OUX65957.1 MAG: ATP synthase F1 subunit gamma [Gammaproteobacteria bacterium TMED281]
MSNLSSIKSVIKSTEKTKKITSAMELVAASKMARTKKSMQQALPYAQTMRRLVSDIAGGNPEITHPFFEERKGKKEPLYFIISSDRGLCGSLNTQLFKSLLEHMKQNNAKKLCIMGNKALQLFKRFGGEIIGFKRFLGDEPDSQEVVTLMSKVVDLYLNNEISEVYLVFNEFVNVMTQKPVVERILPIVPDEPSKVLWDYIYEPDCETLMGEVAKRYLNAVVYGALLENIACEQSARMVAMKSATENAQSLIEELNLAYNKARQAVITTELSEIIAGADAV